MQKPMATWQPMMTGQPMMAGQPMMTGQPMMAGQPMMTGQPMMADHAGMTFPPLLHTVHHCAAVCDHMVTAMIGTPNVAARRNQIRLLVDCAHICNKLATYLANDSPFAKATAALCASICEACGTECARFADEMSQSCAQICLHCARECAAFARS